MKLEKIKNILWNCEKTIDDYANEVGAANEIICFIEQLQNNWNELKKWAKERIENANKCLNDPNENWDEDTNGYVLARKFQLEETLKKMQELEGDVK